MRKPRTDEQAQRYIKAIEQFERDLDDGAIGERAERLTTVRVNLDLAEEEASPLLTLGSALRAVARLTGAFCGEHSQQLSDVTRDDLAALMDVLADDVSRHARQVESAIIKARSSLN